MITYINAKNANQYQVLFEKAAALLRESQPDLGEQTIDWENFEIGSLNEYFAYLETILDVAGKDTNEGKAFLRLPIDEEVLAINADSRNIAVPTSFARNGVGVQGDEMAEILYFTVDRYFDHTDLAGEDIKIAIQWEAKDENKEIIKGITRNFGKEIITVNKKPTMVFGWPISSELTKTNGTIKFAVRFYTIGNVLNEDTNENELQFIYSFTTLPAEITINPSIDYDLINKTVKEIDHGQIITNRVKSNGIYDTSYPTPEDPVITTPLMVQNPTGYETAKIVDLPANDSGVTLGISAKAIDASRLTYNWKQFGYVDGNYSMTNSDLAGEDSVTISYVEVTELPNEDDEQQYYKRQNDTYILIDSLDNITDGDLPIYKKMGVAVVHGVGIYTVDIKARNKINSITKEMAREDGIKIPGPLKPTVSFPQNDNVSDNTDHIISNSGEAVTLTVNAAAGEQGKPASEVGANPQVNLTYKWKKKSGATEIDITPNVLVQILPAADLPTYLPNEEEIEANQWEDRAQAVLNQNNIKITQNGNTITVYPTDTLVGYTLPGEQDDDREWVALKIDGVDDIFWFDTEAVETVTKTVDETTLTFVLGTTIESEEYSFNSAKNELTISGLAAAELDNTYFAEVTATRNGVQTTDKSGDYRITNSPEKPVLKIRTFNPSTNQFGLVTRDYSTEINSVPVGGRPGTTLTFSIEPPEKYDTISYQWMKVNVEDRATTPEDWVDETTVKLQIDLDDSFTKLDSLLNNPHKQGASDIILEAFNFLDNLPAIGNPSDVEEYKDNGPIYTLQNENIGGIYYCIVVVELNGNINANASPFFVVSNV